MQDTRLHNCNSFMSIACGTDNTISKKIIMKIFQQIIVAQLKRHSIKVTTRDRRLIMRRKGVLRFTHHIRRSLHTMCSVSYTHLTLPTIYSV